jgi:hypothetical protein
MDSNLHWHLPSSDKYILHSQGCVILRSSSVPGLDSGLLKKAAAVIVDGATYPGGGMLTLK